MIEDEKVIEMVITRENRLIWGSKNVLVAPQATRDATATPRLWPFSISCLGDSSGSQLRGGTIATASVGNGRRSHPRF